MNYFSEVCRAMTWLGEQEASYFIGQSVKNEGTALFKTLRDVPMNKRLELPVVEELQMGMTIGMAINGTIPVSIFPRQDFLILGMNQLVNHLDKIVEYSRGEFKPKCIIRTGTGSTKPLHPQNQHCNNHVEAFKLMLRNVEVIELLSVDMIFDSYKKAYERQDGKSTLLVEVMDLYNL